MFEQGGTLRTWSTVCLDSLAGGDFAATGRVADSVAVACEKLPDHRLAYLTYEGDISGDRGCVSQVLKGRYIVIADQPDRFEARISWSDGQQSRNAVVCM